MKRRIWSALLILSMLLTMLPSAALATGTESQENIPQIDEFETYETHEGIGSIDDIIPLSQLPSPMGLVSSPSYTGSYYDQLDSASQAVYDAIYSEDSPLKAGPSKELLTIDLTSVPNAEKTFQNVTVTLKRNSTDSYSISYSGTAGTYVSSTISAALGALLYDHPELSWLVNTQFSYGHTSSFNKVPDDAKDMGVGASKDYPNQTITFTEIRYYMSDTGYEDATTAPTEPVTSENSGQANTGKRTDITEAINAAKAAIGGLSGSSDYEKVKAIYDWICNNMEYADKTDGKFIYGWRGYQTAYSALVEHVTVCAGYAKSFKLLCDEYGIPCVIVTGRSHNENHAWNYVQIDNTWYAVDCTWADQSTWISYNYLLKGSDDFPDHDEGTLYSTFQFAYPVLSTTSYTDPSAPASIELTYSPEEDGIGTTASGEKVPAFSIPTIISMNTPTVKEITLTATVPNIDGDELTDRTVEWLLNRTEAGIILTPAGNNTAKLTITNSALSNYDSNSGPIITVTASCSTAKSEQKFLIYVPTRTAKFVQILKENEIITSDTLTAGSSINYTAKVYDQYGQEMSGQTVTWTVSNSSLATVTDGTVTVDTSATEDSSFTVTASVGTSVTGSVNVTISHKHNMTHYEAKEATCKDTGNNEYYTCSVCGKVFKDANGTTETTVEAETIAKLTTHTWGDWAVTKQATETEAGSKIRTCSVCGETETEIIPATGHTLTKVEAKEATCKDTGNNEYYTCSVCGKVFKDANGTTETTVEAETIAKLTTHTWGDWTVTKQATETEVGSKIRTCSVCGETETEIIPATGHTLTKVEAKAATCKDTGNNEYYTCSVCGKVFKDANGLTETTVEAETIAKLTTHTWGDWTVTKTSTCMEAGVKAHTCSVCGETETETIPATGHTLTKVEAKNATCKDTGNNEYYTCSVCGKVFRDAGGTTETTVEAETIAKLTTHTWSDWVVTKQATETEDGSKTRTCSICGETETETIPATGHTLTKVEAKAATCTESGNIEYWHCQGCGKYFSDAEAADEIAEAHTLTAALGHDWGEWIVTKEATCTETGIETRTCSHDTDHTETREVAALGHDYQAVVTAPTCTEQGYTTYTCSRCSDSYIDNYVDALGHNWSEWTITKDATEDEAGEQTRTCSRCHETETQVIPALEHTHKLTHYDAVAVTCTEAGNIEYWHCEKCDKYFSDAEATIEITEADTEISALGHTVVTDAAVAATCTDTGLTEGSHCSVCGEVLVAQEVVAALGHNWSEWTITKDATEDEAGEQTRTCSRCHETETQVIPALEHTHKLTHYDAVTVTCTEAGNIEYWHCEKCDKYFSDAEATIEITEADTEISALGHTVVTDAAVAATCTDTGLTEGSHCSVCGEVLVAQEVVAALGHDWSEWTITKDATEDEAGEQTRTCSRCHETETQVIPALEHTHKLTHYDAVAATCTEAGNIEYWYCEGCGKYFSDAETTTETTETETLTAALGHGWGEWIVTKEATEYEAGEKTRTCFRCNEAETEIIPALGHTHQLTHYGAIDATCTTSGNIEYWYCEGCGKYFSDAETTTETTETETLTAALGHDWGEWIVTKEATEYEAGEQARICNRCGETETQAIPQLTHSFSSDWSKDETYHWHDCTDEDCTAISEKAAHTWNDGEVTTAPTYDATGVRTYTCTVCGATKTETITTTPQLTITPSTTSLTGAGTVKLTVSGIPTGDTVIVTCNDASITVNGSGTSFTASLPNATKTYTFTVSYESATATCTVSVTRYTSGGSSSGSSSSNISSPSRTYAASVSSASNGSVSVSSTHASKGTTVSITVTPDDGYELDNLTVTDAKGNVLTLTDKGDGKYTFTMPASKITVEAAFVEIDSGDDPVTNPFTDVSESMYYYDAVLWAVENGITNGYDSATTFAPDVNCNRAEAVTFLWRAAGCPIPKTTTNPFADVSESAYYYKAVLWAMENGITNGYGSATTFAPDVNCGRAEIVTFLWRAAGSPAVSSGNGFDDVSDSDYYANAVIWAVENSVTNGYGSATTFAPDVNCSRAEIVTFLYRAIVK